MSESSLPLDAWKYTDPTEAERRLLRISRSKRCLDAFTVYVATSARFTRFSQCLTLLRDRSLELGIKVPAFGASNLEAMYQHQHGRCFYCHFSLGEDFETDHKRPLSRNGTNALSNVVLACFSCNRSKRAKTPKEFRTWVAKRDQPVLFEESA